MGQTCYAMADDRSQLPAQLALDIRWDTEAALEDFIEGGNADAVEAVRAAAAGEGAPSIYLYGGASTGKSHLLQAACRRVSAAGGSAVYLPLDALHGYPPALLLGMESSRLVAVDRLTAIASSPEWQEGLFHLFNRVRDAGGVFLAAGRERPDRLGLALPDLVSRLGWGLVFRLRELGETDKRRALTARALRRGLELPEEVLNYLMLHHRRDADSLFSALDRLDDASLRAQRRLTIPFVRRVLADSG